MYFRFFTFVGLIFFADYAMAKAGVSSAIVAAKSCVESGKALGLQVQNSDAIKDNCFSRALTEASINTKLLAKSNDGSLTVIGYQNLIFVKREMSDGHELISVISGEMSQLELVKAVSLSPDQSMIAVLNLHLFKDGTKRHGLLYFQSKKNGNVAPVRVNNHDSLARAHSISYHPAGKSLLAVTDSKEILSFKVESDSRSPVEQGRPKKRILGDESMFNSPLGAVFADNKLLVLDEKNGIIGFVVDGENLETSFSVKREDIQLTELNHIRYNSNDRVIQVYDSSGKSVSFQN